MSYLSWISDDKLVTACEHLALAVQQGERHAELNFDRNVIDPFAVCFSIGLLKMSPREWRRAEIHRQIDKALSNAIGTFHQQVLSSIDGWQDLNNTNQVDLVNPDRRIIAELKNKHNTLNAAGTVTLYKKLSDLVNSKSSRYKGYTSYYVAIIPKSANGIDSLFYPSDNALGERCKQDEKIRAIDGYRFYALASGSPNALQDLFNVIPFVFRDNGLGNMQDKDIPYLLHLFKEAYGNKI